MQQYKYSVHCLSLGMSYISAKNCVKNFHRDCIELVDYFSWMTVFTIIILPIHEQGGIFPYSDSSSNSLFSVKISIIHFFSFVG